MHKLMGDFEPDRQEGDALSPASAPPIFGAAMPRGKAPSSPGEYALLKSCYPAPNNDIRPAGGPKLSSNWGTVALRLFAPLRRAS